jgi:hypothetical protein
MTNLTVFPTPSLEDIVTTDRTATTYQLYFGRTIDLGNGLFTRVSDREINGFIEEIIVPVFDSFSVSQLQGYWKGVKEDITIITIIGDDLDDACCVYDIGTKYKELFCQEAVLINTFTSFPNLIQ